MMTKQERIVQVDAITREIESHETALKNLNERLEEAEDRNDEDDVKYLKRRIASSERTIRVAKEQMSILSAGASTGKQKRTTQSRGKKAQRA